ncbi:uncharacterized protein [Dysidea avara]|uniref:uncharacterized protein isoform X5 n=1 Tax=Dysidea avara TaxID=196820 RepID=UPI00331ADEB0
MGATLLEEPYFVRFKICTNMGGRKFRLAVHRKNEERKKRQKKCDAIMVQETNEDTTASVSALTCPISLSLAAFTSAHVQSLSQLSRRVKALISKYSTWNITAEDPLIICKLVIQGEEATAVAVIATIVVSSDFHWTLMWRTQQVDTTVNPLFSGVPEKIQLVDDMEKVLTLIDSAEVCVGNPDEKFLDLWHYRSTTLNQISGSCPGYLDTFKKSSPTIRSNNCQLFLTTDNRSGNVRCSACSSYRSTLIVQHQRYKSRPPDDESTHATHITYGCQPVPVLVTRLGGLAKEYRNLSKQNDRLKERIAVYCESNGIEVDDDMHKDLKEIASQSTSFLDDLPPDSFKKIFWNQQIEAASKKDARSMRWHPLIIRWCLHLRHRSGGAYEVLRNSGCLQLPSQRTLRDYTHYVKAASGFSSDVDKMLMSAAKVDSCPEREKCVIMLLDETHLKEDLVFNKHTGCLTGFCNLGDINTHLLKFESEVEGGKPADQVLAKSMMVFMIRGLFTSLQFPYAQFPCTDISGDLLYEPFWEAVRRVENCGLKVLAATLDGNTANRRLIKLHDPTEEVLYKVISPYADDGRHLYFISDPPHLLKTIRNCWQSKNRSLWCNGKSISWNHLVKLYNADIEPGKGTRILPKLKREHIFLTSFSKMRVDLAAQGIWISGRNRSRSGKALRRHRRVLC